MHKTNPFELKNQLGFEQIQRVGRRKGSTECALPFHQHTGKFIGGFASLTPLDATQICDICLDDPDDLDVVSSIERDIKHQTSNIGRTNIFYLTHRQFVAAGTQ